MSFHHYIDDMPQISSHMAYIFDVFIVCVYKVFCYEQIEEYGQITLEEGEETIHLLNIIVFGRGF